MSSCGMANAMSLAGARLLSSSFSSSLRLNRRAAEERRPTTFSHLRHKCARGSHDRLPSRSHFQAAVGFSHKVRRSRAVATLLVAILSSAIFGEATIQTGGGQSGGGQSSGGQCSSTATGCSKRLGAFTYAQQFLSPPYYDKSIHPGLFCLGADAGATKVEAQIYLYALNEVSQKTGEITMSAYLRTWWRDPRLAYNETATGGCYDSPIILSNDQAQTLWNPNLYIDNLVDATWMKDLTYVYPDGLVWRSEQVLLKTKCKFKFVQMPFDSHTCEVVIASYSLGISDVRLVPRGGTIDVAGTGVGLEGEEISSLMWRMQDNPTFQIPGIVQQSGNWDYLHLQYTLTRMPKFYVTQFMIPDLMFLMLVYTGFFVNPNAAPARAAVSVIPVLILRTLSNSVYKSIPLISRTNVWLCDYLLASMFLCCLCTFQFGIVQYKLLTEKPNADRAATLKAKKETVKKCLTEAKKLGVTVAALLKPEDRAEAEEDAKEAAAKAAMSLASGATSLTATSLTAVTAVTSSKATKADEKPAPVEKPPEVSKPPEEDQPDPEAAPEHSSWSWCGSGGVLDFHPAHVEVMEHQTPVASNNPAAAPADKQVTTNLTEADLTLVVYACSLFHGFAKGQGFIGPKRMSLVLKRFNLYYQPDKCKRFMTLFLQDRGLTVNSIEDLHFHVDLFLDFLISVSDYLLAVPPPKHRNPWSKDLPPSVQWDVLFRILFPSMVVLKIVIFFAILPVYPESLGLGIGI